MPILVAVIYLRFVIAVVQLFIRMTEWDRNVWSRQLTALWQVKVVHLLQHFNRANVCLCEAFEHRRKVDSRLHLNTAECISFNLYFQHHHFVYWSPNCMWCGRGVASPFYSEAKTIDWSVIIWRYYNAHFGCFHFNLMYDVVLRTSYALCRPIHWS